VHRQGVLVGITQDRPNLHVFGTAAQPDHPLVLDPIEAWNGLKKSSGRFTFTALGCGDHGSDREYEVELGLDKGKIRQITRAYQCDDDYKRGKQIEQ
jgi:hypothetical protein